MEWKPNPKDGADPMGFFILVVLLVVVGGAVIFAARWIMGLFG